MFRMLRIAQLLTFFWTFQTSIQLQSSQDVSKYMVIIDAGSSHSSFYVFEERNDPKEIEQLAECYIEGGIDEFADLPILLEDYFWPCMEEMYRIVPSDYISQTEIRLGATAGMRLLSDENPEAADKLMEAIEAQLESSQFLCDTPCAAILSGEEEGAYSLFSVNILDGHQMPGIGSLDMGGASAQISFVCEGLGEHCKSYNISQSNVDVYSQSNNCYGLEEALRRFTAALIIEQYLENNKTIQSTVSNPCLNLKERDSWLTKFPTAAKEIFGSPCTKLSPELQDLNDALEEIAEDFNFSHLPAYTSLDACLASMDPLIDFTTCSNYFENAPINCFQILREEIPETEFIAMSSYFWEFRSILHPESESIGLEEATSRLSSLCGTKFDTDDENQTNCFESSYILAFLTKGYGFGSKLELVNFLEDINGNDVSWALGFAALNF